MPIRDHTADTARQAREHHLGTSALRVADPLSKLTDALQQEMLSAVHVKSAKAGEYAAAFRESVGKALRSVLLRDDSHGRILRLQLVQQLVSPELNEPHASEPAVSSTQAAAPVSVEADDPLLTTSVTAQRLGFSRAHIAMLVDADRLRAEHKSEGGHRRIRLSEVLRYQQELQSKRKGATDPKELAQDSALYAVPDREWVAVSLQQRALERMTLAPSSKTPKRPASKVAKNSKTKG